MPFATRIDDDYVNISTKDTPLDGGDSTAAMAAAVGNDLQQNNTTTCPEDGWKSRFFPDLRHETRQHAGL